MFTSLGFPIMLHIAAIWSGKNCQQDFQQIFRTIRGGLHLGLQGAFISGKNLFPVLLALIKSAKISIVSRRDLVTRKQAKELNAWWVQFQWNMHKNWFFIWINLLIIKLGFWGATQYSVYSTFTTVHKKWILSHLPWIHVSLLKRSGLNGPLPKQPGSKWLTLPKPPT